MATVIKNIPYIGGNTAVFEFDFGTKVAGSVTECPMNIYWSFMSSLQTPSSILPDVNGNELKGMRLVGANSNYNWEQGYYDSIKIQDSNYNSTSTATASPANPNGAIAQLMVELDLNPLCSSLFGGSHSALIAALQRFIISCYCKGTGPNGNSVRVELWNAGVNKWPSQIPWGPDGLWNGIIGGTTISCATLNSSTNGGNLPITSDNKMYIIIYAATSSGAVNPSNGTIASEVDLDYINIKLNFARVPDVINLVPITLPNTWSILVKGLAFAYSSDSLSSSTPRTIIAINTPSNNSNYDFSYATGKFTLDNWDGNTPENLYTSAISFNKFQTINALLEQTTTGLRMRILKNNDTVIKTSMSSSRNFSGTKDLNLLMNRGNNQADAFLNSLIFLPNKTFDDDTEAESILRGTADGFEDDELVTDGTFQNGLTSYPDHGVGITTSSNGITFTATGSWANQVINVLPNNQYYIKSTRTCACIIEEFYNNIKLNAISVSDQAFTVSSKTNKVRISLYPTAINQYCSSVSLKLKM